MKGHKTENVALGLSLFALAGLLAVLSLPGTRDQGEPTGGHSGITQGERDPYRSCLASWVASPQGVTLSEAETECSGETGIPVTAPSEDSPSWDCETQGNQICGPVSVVLAPDNRGDVSAVSGLAATGLPVAYSGDFGAVFGSEGGRAYVAALDSCSEGESATGLVVLAPSPESVREGETRAAVTGRQGNCLLAIGAVLLY